MAKWFENQQEVSVRDFVLQALAEGRTVAGNGNGYIAYDLGEIIEGEWFDYDDTDALLACGTEWRWEQEIDAESGTPYFFYGENRNNWLWFEDGSWYTDGEGNTCEPTRWNSLKRAADFIEVRARELAAL